MNNIFYIIQLPKISTTFFIILNLFSMILYPGGNINNPNQEGYSLSYNFFSDLGTTISYSNDSNLISCILFNFSLCLIGLSFSILFFKLKSIFKEDKLLSIIASICGVLSGFAYIGVAFTPANLYLDVYGNPWLHIFFAHWAFRLVFISSILYAVLIIKANNFNNKYAYNFIVFGCVVLIYVLYSEFFLNDPRIYPEDLINHVIAQKVIVLWMMLSIYIYSIGLGKYFNNKINND